MKKLPLIFLLALAALLLVPACSTDTNSDLINAYNDWNEENQAWLNEEMVRRNPDGSLYYKQVVPKWDPSAYVLIHYFNDTTLTRGNLTPMLTSTVDTRYRVTYYEGTPIDSSMLQTTYGPGIFRTQVNQVISGWAIALENMHVGDTAVVVIPYQQGYGLSTSSGILPYSVLIYNMSLVDIPYYEVNPK